METPSFDEFRSSLISYLNANMTTDGMLTEVSDQRESMLGGYLELPAAQLVAFMGDAPHDLAALLSGAVCVANPTSAQLLAATDDPVALIGTLQNDDTLPLSSDNGLVSSLLDELIKLVPNGCELYAAITVLLWQAFQDPQIRPFLASA